METLASLIVKIGADISEYTNEMEKAAKQLGQIGAKLSSLGSTMTTAITLPVAALGGAALETAGKFEQTQIAFKHFLGSAEAAKAELQDLYNFAASTPFQIGDVTKGAQSLMAMGFATKDLIPLLTTLGDQLSAVGRPENMQALIIAFGEMKAKGVASMKEIRQMATDGVIPAVRYLAEGLGVTESQVFDMLKNKAIDSGTAIKLITAGMAKDTGGLMKESMGGFVATLSNLKDKATLTLKEVGDALLPLGKDIINLGSSVLSAVNDMAHAFALLPVPLQEAALGSIAFVAAIGPAIFGAGLMMNALKSVLMVVPLFTASIVTSSAALATFAAATLPAAIAAIARFSVEILTGATPSLVAFAVTAVRSAIASIGALSVTLTNQAILAFALFRTVGIGPAITAMGQTVAASKILTGTLATLSLGATLAASAFAGWQLGTWLRDNIPMIQRFGDGIADLIGKWTGLYWAIDQFGGKAAEVARHQQQLEVSVGRLEMSLKDHGVTVARGSMTLEEYSQALLKAAAGAGPLKGETEKLKDGMAALEEAMKALKTEHGVLSEAQNYGAIASDKVRANNLAMRDTFFLLHPELAKSHVAFDSLTGKMKEFSTSALSAVMALISYNKAQADIVSQGPFLPHLTQSSAAMQGIADQAPEIASAISGMVAVVLPGMQDMTNVTLSVEEAYRTLGVVSLDTLKKVADAAVEAYDTVLHSGQHSWLKITEAAIAAGKAQRDVAAAMGEDVTAATATNDAAQEQVDAMNGKIATSAQAAGQKMSKAMKQVSTVVTDLSRGIADAIVHWKGFGDAATKIAQDVGEAIIRYIVEDALKKMLVQLGNVMISLNGIWAKLGAILKSAGGGGISGGASSGAGSAAGGVASAGGSAASAVGGIAGMAVSGVVGAVAGVVGAVSSIIGNFQMMAMNKSLDLIEANTRYTQIALIGPGGVLSSLNTYLPGVVGIQDRINDVRKALFTPIASDLEAIYSKVGGSGGGSGAVINMTFNGVTDPRQMAESLVTQLRIAGVKV